MGKTMIRGQEKERTHQLSDQQQNKELKDDYSFDEIQELSKFFESNDDYNTNQIIPVAREPLESLNHTQNISTGHNDARPASHDRLDREIAEVMIDIRRSDKHDDYNEERTSNITLNSIVMEQKKHESEQCNDMQLLEKKKRTRIDSEALAKKRKKSSQSNKEKPIKKPKTSITVQQSDAGSSDDKPSKSKNERCQNKDSTNSRVEKMKQKDQISKEAQKALKQNGTLPTAKANTLGCKHTSMIDMRVLSNKDFKYYIQEGNELHGAKCSNNKCKNKAVSMDWPLKQGIDGISFCCPYATDGRCWFVLCLPCGIERRELEIKNNQIENGRLRRNVQG